MHILTRPRSISAVRSTSEVLLLSKYWETQGALATSDNAKVLFFPPKATVPLTYEGLKEVVQGSE